LSGTDKATARPWIWLQDSEREGAADCGCRLVAEHDGSGPALFACDGHGSHASLLSERDAALARCAELEQALRDVLSYGWGCDNPETARKVRENAARAVAGGKGGA
jgi:hypothetical protein